MILSSTWAASVLYKGTYVKSNSPMLDTPTDVGSCIVNAKRKKIMKGMYNCFVFSEENKNNVFKERNNKIN